MENQSNTWRTREQLRKCYRIVKKDGTFSVQVWRKGAAPWSQVEWHFMPDEYTDSRKQEFRTAELAEHYISRKIHEILLKSDNGWEVIPEQDLSKD